MNIFIAYFDYYKKIAWLAPYLLIKVYLSNGHPWFILEIIILKYEMINVILYFNSFPTTIPQKTQFEIIIWTFLQIVLKLVHMCFKMSY